VRAVQQEAPNLEQFAFAQSRAKDGAALVSIDFTDTTRGPGDSRHLRPHVAPSTTRRSDCYNYGVESRDDLPRQPGGKLVGDLIGPVSVANLNNLLGQARAAASVPCPLTPLCLQVPPGPVGPQASVAAGWFGPVCLVIVVTVAL